MATVKNPAQAYVDEGTEKGFVAIQHDDSPAKGVAEGNEPSAYLEALSKGYMGEQQPEN